MDGKDFREKYCTDVIVVCPYCGHSDFSVETSESKVSIKCCNCGLIGPEASDVSEASTKWNNRISQVDKCFFCGNDLQDGFCQKCHSKKVKKQYGIDDYSCCYIDILGFSNYTNSQQIDIRDCARLIENYAQIIENKSITNDFKSFLHFHPASDGIFIISQNPDSFVIDLCEFCYSSYNLTSLSYSHPEDPSDVAKVTVAVVSSNGVTHEKEHWFPSIFSGGISVGTLLPFKQPASYYGQDLLVPNYVGSSITKAVKCGASNNSLKKHGARIYCDEEFVLKLSPDIRNKYILNHDDIYELLWPVAIFIDENDVEFNMLNGLSGIFEEILNFYMQYKDNEKVEKVYFNTLKMIFCCSKQYFEYRNAPQEIRDRAELTLIGRLRDKNLQSIEDDIKNPSFWK